MSGDPAVRLDPVADAAVLAPVLADLHAACFAGTAQRPWSASAIETIADMPGTVSLIAQTPADQAVGFVIGRAVADEAEILTLCVAPAFRRRGIGAALLRALFARLPCRGRIVLEVAVDNVAARALYAALGFREVGRRRGYYRNATTATDALILAATPGRIFGKPI